MSKFALTGLLILYTSLSYSQFDAHYWAYQYGTKGLLLNGANIGNPDDITAIYYNPGVMGLVEENGLSLSLILPSISRITQDDYLGEGTSFSNTDAQLLPEMTALKFRLFKNPNLSAAVTIFTKYNTDVSSKGSALTGINGQSDRQSLGIFDYRNTFRQRWIGFNVAYRLNQSFSWGFSQFAVVHSQRYSFQQSQDIFAINDPNSILESRNQTFDTRFGIGSLLTKIGFAWRKPRSRIGLTITTPNYFNLYKSADYDLRREEGKIGQQPTIQTDFSQGVDELRYRTPFSMGWGIEKDLGRIYKLSFSAEYFAGIKEYTLLANVDPPIIAGGTSEPIELKEAAKDVVNVALGLECSFSEKFSLMMGGRTDFNHQKDIDLPQNNLNIIKGSWDVFHVSVGGNFKINNNYFSIGLDYAFASDDKVEPVANINGFEAGLNSMATVDLKMLTLILTYDFLKGEL